MFGRNGRLLYVGKAINLRRRLCSYFQSKPDRIKTAQLVQEIADIEIMIVRNENESLMLETNLIQYYLPPYNRAKKRERSVFAYIAATEELFPRLLAADRERQAPLSAIDGSGGERLIGPFPNPVFRNYALEFAIERFRLRTCSPLESRLCMRYYLGKCGGICEGMQSDEQYVRSFNDALSMLDDPTRVPFEMDQEVERLAERLQFEKAKEVHVRAKALRSMLVKQTVNIPRDHFQLIVYFGVDHLLAARIEYGMLRTRFVWEKLHGSEQEGSNASDWAVMLAEMLPSAGKVEIVTNDRAHAETLAREARLRRLTATVTVPVRGDKKQLLNICERNFQYRSDADASYDMIRQSLRETAASRFDHSAEFNNSEPIDP